MDFSHGLGKWWGSKEKLGPAFENLLEILKHPPMPGNMREKVKWPFGGGIITRSEARDRLQYIMKHKRLGTAIENLKLIAKRPFDKPVASKDEALRRLHTVIEQDRSTNTT